MKEEQIVSEVISAIEKKNWNKLENRLADDFTFSGAVPKPISKKEWVGVHRALQTGMPDLKMNLHQVHVEGHKVIAKVQLAGTHTAEMPSPIVGFNPIPKTGKKVQLPEEEIEITFKGDKLVNWYVKPTPHGGVMGVLEQIGAPVDATNANLRIVQQAFSEFRNGNIKGVLDFYAEDAQWSTYENPTIPFAKTFKGKNEVKKFFTLLDENMTFSQFEPKEFICQNENVVVLGHQVGKVKKTGKTIEQDFCFVVKLRNQKIYSTFTFVDTRIGAEAFK